MGAFKNLLGHTMTVFLILNFFFFFYYYYFMISLDNEILIEIDYWTRRVTERETRNLPTMKSYRWLVT